MIYGYVRVSTDGQSVDRQVRRLRAAGAGRVFREVASGARADRPGLRRAIAKLEEGDVLMVMQLDRLARSTRDLLNSEDELFHREAPIARDLPPKPHSCRARERSRRRDGDCSLRNGRSRSLPR